MAGPARLTDVGPVTRVEFRVEDMDCASCLDTIRRSLEKRPGVVAVEGSPISRRLEIDYDPATVDAEAIRREVSDLGYRVLAPSTSGESSIKIWSSRRALRAYVAGTLLFAGLVLRLALHGTIVDSHGCPAWPGL